MLPRWPKIVYLDIFYDVPPCSNRISGSLSYQSFMLWVKVAYLLFTLLFFVQAAFGDGDSASQLLDAQAPTGVKLFKTEVLQL